MEVFSTDTFFALFTIVAAKFENIQRQVFHGLVFYPKYCGEKKDFEKTSSTLKQMLKFIRVYQYFLSTVSKKNIRSIWNVC